MGFDLANLDNAYGPKWSAKRCSSFMQKDFAELPSGVPAFDAPGMGPDRFTPSPGLFTLRGVSMTECGIEA